MLRLSSAEGMGDDRAAFEEQDGGRHPRRPLFSHGRPTVSMSAPSIYELCRPWADWLEGLSLIHLGLTRGGQSSKCELRRKGGLFSG